MVGAHVRRKNKGSHRADDNDPISACPSQDGTRTLLKASPKTEIFQSASSSIRGGGQFARPLTTERSKTEASRSPKFTLRRGMKSLEIARGV